MTSVTLGAGRNRTLLIISGRELRHVALDNGLYMCGPRRRRLRPVRARGSSVAPQLALEARDVTSDAPDAFPGPHPQGEGDAALTLPRALSGVVKRHDPDARRRRLADDDHSPAAWSAGPHQPGSHDSTILPVRTRASTNAVSSRAHRPAGNDVDCVPPAVDVAEDQCEVAPPAAVAELLRLDGGGGAVPQHVPDPERAVAH